MRVNTQLLEEKIEASGLRIDFICMQLGISDTAFLKKRKGLIPFRGAEVYVLCDLLKISAEEKPKIFYPEGSNGTEPQKGKHEKS